MPDLKERLFTEREALELATIFAITSVAVDIKEDMLDGEDDNSIREMPDPDYMSMVEKRRAAYLADLRKKGQIEPERKHLR